MIAQRHEQAGTDAGQKSEGYFNILVELESVRHIMSVEEVAQLLGKSVSTIYRMVRQRQIPSFRLAGSIGFDPSALAMWLTKKDPTLAVAARLQRAA